MDGGQYAHGALGHAQIESARGQGQSIPNYKSWDRLGFFGFRRNPIDFLHRATRQHRDIVKFWILGFPLVLISHPMLVHEVLVRNHQNYDKRAFLYDLVRPVLRDGLIGNVGGAHWRRQRKLMQPVLRATTVPNFTRNMTEESLQLVERWRAAAHGGDEVELTSDIAHVALRIVTRSMFGIDIGEGAREFERAFANANSGMGAYFARPFPPLSVPTANNRRILDSIATMDEFVTEFIETRRKSGTTHDDLLDMLLSARDEASESMSTPQLHAEILNLLIGGYETTTNTVSWIFHLLSTHPEIERKFHHELDDVLAGRTATHEDLARLPVTRRIVDETLRLYSPAWQTMRRAIADDTVGPYHIPAGTNVYLNTYVIHRHPEFWENPDQFEPDRFTPERSALRPKHAYIPFGAGPRVCIGKHFALAELMLISATIGQHYRLTTTADARPVELNPLITLQPKHGIRLHVRFRKH